MDCDLAVPGTGPMKMIGPSKPSTELEKFRTYNTSMRSKNDLHLSPHPDGNIKTAFGSKPNVRQGIYAIQTDRGQLNATVETQTNMKGRTLFQNRLQDKVKPTTKDTLLHTAEGNVGGTLTKQTEYSSIIPTYVDVNGKKVRVSGNTNYSLKTAAEHSYTPAAQTTGLNNSVFQDPDKNIANLWKRPDNNVDGPGTFKGALPDNTRSQRHKIISTPTSNGLRLTYNLEASEANVLGQVLPGVEERFTSAYQIAPLMSNPLHKIWNPDDKGDLPAFYTNSNPADFSYIHQTKLPNSEFIPGASSNSYVLGLSKGLQNNNLQWSQDINRKPGVIYDENNLAPGKSYSGSLSIAQLYPLQNTGSDYCRDNYGQYGLRNDIITTLGDPTAGFL